MAFTERVTRPTINPLTLAGVGFALAIVIIFAGNYNVPEGENGGTGPAIVTSIICLLLTAGLFGYLVPRVAKFDRTVLILGILAVVSIIAFWSGVTPVLTAAALAIAGRSDTAPPRRVLIAEVLAILATLLTLVWTLAQSHIF